MPELGHATVLCVLFTSNVYIVGGGHGRNGILNVACSVDMVSRFFLVFLGLKANAEVVPNFPSCHYMLLM
jgi:hypothetical protein